MGATGIPYLTDAWNPITGCSEVGPECTECWAQRCLAMGRSGGEPKPVIHRDRLDEPFHWHKARERVGVCFMGDLFHESVPDDWIADVLFPVHVLNGHGWYLLTKRAERMSAYFVRRSRAPEMAWVGVTAGLQATAEARTRYLLSLNHQRCWLSMEPLLERVDLSKLSAWRSEECPIKWVVVGCHNGRLRDRCTVSNVQRIVDQCRRKGVKVWVKQLFMNGRVCSDVSRFPVGLKRRDLPEQAGR